MKFLVFLGTVRDSTPPKPARLGERVAESCLKCLNQRYCEHEFELIDALDFPSEDVFKPHFAYAKSQAPAHLTALADKITQAEIDRYFAEAEKHLEKVEVPDGYKAGFVEFLEMLQVRKS